MPPAEAVTIAQDEATCVVFGMPKEAIGGVGKILRLQKNWPKCHRGRS
ncbi:MAG: chemotaxis protein CheB [Mariniblastus sp.]